MSRQAIKDFGGYARSSDEVLSKPSKNSRVESMDGYDGSGEYPDRNRDIVSQQKQTVSKLQSQKMKEGYRQ